MKHIDDWTSSETSDAWKILKGRGIKTKEDLVKLKAIEKRHLELTGFALPKVFIAKELL
jgi:hypothetical protein